MYVKLNILIYLRNLIDVKIKILIEIKTNKLL